MGGMLISIRRLRMRRDRDDRDFTVTGAVMPEHSVGGRDVVLGIRLPDRLLVAVVKRCVALRTQPGIPGILPDKIQALSDLAMKNRI